MSVYLEPIKNAVFIFPIIAALFTIPYMIQQYRKYGAMFILRISIIYSLILYLMCAYFIVLLPLPKNDIQHFVNPMQLQPFASVDSIIEAVHKASSFFKIFLQPIVFETIFNVFLTLPLGVYLRYYFNRKWYQVILIGFCVSLSFELLQLTGICGIYHYPYRLFDVDDLIVNTFGAYCGFLLTPVFTHFLPSKSQLDEKSYKKGQTVSFTRRLLAISIDLIIVGGLDALAYYLFKPSLELMVFGGYLLDITLYFGLLTYLFKGQTLGKMIVKIGLVDKQSQKPPTYGQCISRYGLLFLQIVMIPFVMEKLYDYLPLVEGNIRLFIIVELIILALCFFGVVFRVIIYQMIMHKDVLYEKLSQTVNISLVTKGGSRDEEIID